LTVATTVHRMDRHLGQRAADKRRRVKQGGAVLVLALALVFAGFLVMSRDAAHPLSAARPHWRVRAANRSPTRRQTSAPSPLPNAVGLRVLRLVDRTRSILLPNGQRRPRVVLTYVRYPANGLGLGDRRNAPASGGPFPLVVFGHGFAVTPSIYGTQLRAWARAGFVVAAPVFPLGNANAPGGPNEADIVNQPRDMSLVISRLLAASANGRNPLVGLIDAKRIAVAGHSDVQPRTTAATVTRGSAPPSFFPAHASRARCQRGHLRGEPFLSWPCRERPTR